jgi:hypothetical protein
VPGTEAELNDAVIALVEELKAFAGPNVRQMTIHVQASGEYPYAYLDPSETLPVAGMAVEAES